MPYSQSDVRAYLDSYGGLLGTRVEMVETDSQCFVRVIEDEEERTYSFEPGSFALAFAERQRVRLRLPAIERPLTQPRYRGPGRVNANSGVSDQASSGYPDIARHSRFLVLDDVAVQ